jgi:hypothetical protein
LIDWEYRACPDLKLSNRPVRTRMPGGVAGVPPIMEAPYADCPFVVEVLSRRGLWCRRTSACVRLATPHSGTRLFKLHLQTVL